MRIGFDHPGIGVCTMCHDGQGKYLVGQRSPNCKDKHYAWHPIGTGAIEPHESIEDAVRREVLEECGAEPTDLQFIGFRETFREHEGESVHWIMFDYRVRVDPAEVRITEPEKCLEHRWVAVDEIPEPRHSQFPEFLKKYTDIL